MRYCSGPQKTVLHIVREDGGRAAKQPYERPGCARALCSASFRLTTYDPAVRVCVKCEAMRQKWILSARTVLAQYDPPVDRRRYRWVT